MSENVNTTMIATQPSSCPRSPTAEKIGTIFACSLIFLVSLVGNTVIGIIVFKTKTMRKPINFFIVNMAISDIMLPIFKIPQLIQVQYIDYWPIGGPLGEALCKLVYFLKDVSVLVSIQSLVLIAVDRFGAVVYPLRSPLSRTKMCPFFSIASWIVAIAVNSPKLFVLKLVEYPEKLVCSRRWSEAFGESSSQKNYLLSFKVASRFIPLVLIAILYIIIYIKLRSRALGQLWTTTKTKGAKCVKDGHCYSVRVCNVLASPRYLAYSLHVYGHDPMAELYLPTLFLHCPIYGSGKLCYKSLYLFSFQQKLS